MRSKFPFSYLFFLVAIVLLVVVGGVASAQIPKQEIETYRASRSLIKTSPEEAKSGLAQIAQSESMLAGYAKLDLARLFLADGDGDKVINLLDDFDTRLPAKVRAQAGALVIKGACLKVKSKECGNSFSTYSKRKIPATFRAERLFIRAEHIESIGARLRAYKTYQEVYYKYPADGFAEKARLSTVRMREENRKADKKIKFPYASFKQRMQRARRLLAAYRYDASARELKELLKIGYSEKRKISAQLMLGEVYDKGRQRRLAKQAYLAYLKKVDKGKSATQVEYRIAVMDWNLGKSDLVRDRLQKLLKKPAEKIIRAKANLVLGRIAEGEKKYDLAESYYRAGSSLVKKGKTGKTLKWRSAWISYLAGRYKTSADKFLAMEPDSDGRNLYWAARSLLNLGLKEKSDELLGQVAKKRKFGYYGSLAIALLGRDGDMDKSDIKSKADEAQKDLPPGLGLEDGAERYRALLSLDMKKYAYLELKDLLAKRSKNLKTALLFSDLFRIVDRADKSLSILHPYFDRLSSSYDFSNPFWKLYFPLPYSNLLFGKGKNRGVDPLLAGSIIRQESAFDPKALSPAGAKGLMQIIDATARRLYEKNKKYSKSGKPFAPSFSFDPETNLELGVDYLFILLKRYDGTTAFVIAAYNAGEEAVDRWRKEYSDVKEDEFVEMIPYAETRKYVKRVKRNLSLYNAIYGKMGGDDKPERQ